MKRIIYVSGPSGMAKTSLQHKLEELGGPLGIGFERTIITTSRAIRQHERQGDPWYFATAEQIAQRAAEAPNDYLTTEVRQGEPQGLDAGRELGEKLARADTLWCELHSRWLPLIAGWLARNGVEAQITKVFLAPLTAAEVAQQVAAGRPEGEVITAEMRRRLRARRAAGLDNMDDRRLERRARAAAEEYAGRHEYDCVIANHQGEESPEWGAPGEFPTGEAARVLQQLVALWRA